MPGGICNAIVIGIGCDTIYRSKVLTEQKYWNNLSICTWLNIVMSSILNLTVLISSDPSSQIFLLKYWSGFMKQKCIDY